MSDKDAFKEFVAAHHRPAQLEIYRAIAAMLEERFREIPARVLLPAIFALLQAVGRSGEPERDAVIAAASLLVKKLGQAEPGRGN